MRALYKYVLFSTSKKRCQWFWKPLRRQVRPLFFDGRKNLSSIVYPIL